LAPKARAQTAFRAAGNLRKGISLDVPSFQNLSGSVAGYLQVGDEMDLVVGSLKPDGQMLTGEFHDGWREHTVEIRPESAPDFFEGTAIRSDDQIRFWASFSAGRLNGLWRSGASAGRFEIWGESRRQTLAARAFSGIAQDGLDWEGYLAGRESGAFTIQDETGFWKGGYEDRTGQADEDLHLTFHSGIVRGRGCDKDGRFAVIGSYHPHTNSVYWNKHYVRPHRIFSYQGVYEEGQVKGVWAESGLPEHCGPFEIKPLLDLADTRL
jgi:hypothetical protein